MAFDAPIDLFGRTIAVAKKTRTSLESALVDFSSGRYDATGIELHHHFMVAHGQSARAYFVEVGKTFFDFLPTIQLLLKESIHFPAGNLAIAQAVNLLASLNFECTQAVFV